MNKNSKRREEILQALINRKDHPSAIMLYEDLKKQNSTIGIATVYRNLINLYDEGKIIKITDKEGTDRFDANIEPHIHYECKNCGNIIDIILSEEKKKEYIKNMKDITEQAEATYINSILKIQGFCNKCRL